MQNNYVLQVQSLINQQAIITPSGSTRDGGTLSSKEGTLSSSDDFLSSKKESLVARKKENIKEIVCLNCKSTFTAARSTRMYCSGACKEAYRRKMKKEI